MRRSVSLAVLLGVGALADAAFVVLPSGTTQDLLSIHFVDAQRGWAAGRGGTVRRTTDGGATWTDASPGSAPELNAVFFLDASTGVVAGQGGAIFRTTDGGTSWVPVASGVPEDLHSLSFSGLAGICGVSGGGTLRSTDGGATWSIPAPPGFSNPFFGAHMTSATTGFVGGQNAVFQPIVGKTTDAGATWSYVAFYLNGNEGVIRDVDFPTATLGFAASIRWDGRGTISRSTDGGASFSTILLGAGLRGIDMADAAGTVGFAVGGTGDIVRTTDGGTSWQSLTSPVSVTLHAVSFVDTSTGYAAGDGGTIIKTTTGGTCPSITISPASPPEGVEGATYAVTFTAAGGVPPYTYAVTSGSLPAGLTLGANGVLSGTPTLAGTSAFEITVTDASGCTGLVPLAPGP